jgi:oligoribonuclease NrnB/cAMP/cGMP phosphodiesterase (DHH superfamily)
MGIFGFFKSPVEKALEKEELKHFRALELAYNRMFHAQKDFREFLSRVPVDSDIRFLSDDKKSELHHLSAEHLSAVNSLGVAVFDVNIDVDTEHARMDNLFFRATGKSPKQVDFEVRLNIAKNLSGFDVGSFRKRIDDLRAKRVFDISGEKKDLGLIENSYRHIKRIERAFKKDFPDERFGFLLDDREKKELYRMALAHSRGVEVLKTATIDLSIRAWSWQGSIESYHSLAFGKKTVEVEREIAALLKDGLSLFDRDSMASAVFERLSDIRKTQVRVVGARR